MSGTVVTFYSFKGGVGRSFAVANIAVILAQWGYRVLAIDWDIEAPGLHHYFADYVPKLSPGVLDFLSDCEKDAPGSWDSYAQAVPVPDCGTNLFLMPAAASDGRHYTDFVQGLDWEVLYAEHDLGTHLEALRAAWVRQFDIVLVDSRTGVTDFSGLTTAQLPDVLAFLFTANHQSLDGCCDIVRRAMETRRKLPLDRAALVPLPIVAKFEQREEYDRAQAWRKKFADQLAKFYNIWAPSSIETIRLVDLLTIPYVPRWTFGEDLAAVQEPHNPKGPRTTSSPMSYPLETIAALLANRFSKIDLLSSSRDEYVLTAHASAHDLALQRQDISKVFISYSRQDSEVAKKINDAMLRRGLRTFFYDELNAGDSFEAAIASELEEATAFIVLVSPAALKSTWINQEIEAFLRRSLRSKVAKPLIPLLLPGVNSDALLSSRLANYQSLLFDPGKDFEAQLEPVFRNLSGFAPERTASAAADRRVYLYHAPEDADIALDLADDLALQKIEVVMSVHEGPPAEIAKFHRRALLDCNTVILFWASASEVWLRTASRELRDWRQLGRATPFARRCVVVAPPPSRSKKAYVKIPPRSEIDMLVDLSLGGKLTPTKAEQILSADIS